jgi:hypothetical protein
MHRYVSVALAALFVVMVIAALFGTTALAHG